MFATLVLVQVRSTNMFNEQRLREEELQCSASSSEGEPCEEHDSGQQRREQLAAQIRAAKGSGKSREVILGLEAQYLAAKDREAQARTWRLLGGLAIIGVVGVLAAGSFALITRAVKK